MAPLLAHCRWVLLLLAAWMAIAAETTASDGVADTDADRRRPVIAYWDGGRVLLGEPPAVIVAVWQDGLVVRKQDRGLVYGRIAPAEVVDLRAAVRRSGYFEPLGSRVLDTYGLVFPDGPMRCLSIRDGRRWKTLVYHERPELDSADDGADPSREQCARYAARWSSVVAEIRRIKPPLPAHDTGNRLLEWPLDRR